MQFCEKNPIIKYMRCRYDITLIWLIIYYFFQSGINSTLFKRVSQPMH